MARQPSHAHESLFPSDATSQFVIKGRAFATERIILHALRLNIFSKVCAELLPVLERKRKRDMPL